MTERALGAREHRVVVGQYGTRGPLAKELLVDGRGASHETVGGRPGEQFAEFAAGALRGDREATVLDEAAGVDEVLDVFARRPRGLLMTPRDSFGTRYVLRQRAPLA